MPEQNLRLTVGDTDPITSGFQRSSEILGISLQKSNRKFNPGENIAATGSSSFRIERTSDVDVIINGSTMQRLHLRPGNYNLRDLPLATGANDIALAITDENGEKQTLSFTTYFDGALLAEGQSEWAAGAGLPSYLRDNERAYAEGIYTGRGHYRYGLSDEVTGEASLHGDSNVAVAGLGIPGAIAVGSLRRRRRGFVGRGRNGSRRRRQLGSYQLPGSHRWPRAKPARRRRVQKQGLSHHRRGPRPANRHHPSRIQLLAGPQRRLFDSVHGGHDSNNFSPLPVRQRRPSHPFAAHDRG